MTYKQKLKTELLKNKSGITLNWNLSKPNHKKGFYVSLTNNQDNNINRAINKLSELKESLKDIKRASFIGFWFDDKDKTFYLDISVYCYKQITALNIAKKYNQKAIFNLKNLNSVYL